MSVKVRSEISANVWQVRVAAGDRVASGDTLVVLESMKMEIPIEAPAGGIVQSIDVTEGSAVSEGQVLIVLEP